MSSIILPQLGAMAGASIAGPVGAGIGHGMASVLASEIDQNFLFPNKKSPIIGPRLAELALQTATYGRMIPIIYGKVKLAGNIIWASEIREERHDHYQRRSKFAGKTLVAREFNYSISLAIAIAEGEISEILRVWLNDKLVDPRKANYRFYNGSESQMPDPLIEATIGHKRTPAFRGLSYIVIEDLKLGEFAGHIPNFIFEVKRKVRVQYSSLELPLEERIKAMVMIPGSGEFVYDPVIQAKMPKNYNLRHGYFNGQKTKINQNNREGKADSIVALDQLSYTCPNLEWIAPVVGWFANSVDAANCSIMPGVEYRDGSSSPDNWQVAGFNRASARLISQNKSLSPIYGGTSNDNSILRYLDLIRERNYKIMFYPMIFVDQQDKPWRGRITGTPEEIRKFFYAENGYNNFILYYARLTKDKVDAFIIGSELIGLTKIKDKDNKFPAVEALINLAKQVKQIMGDKVKISYAADWSEYHHTDNGWYNLDPLWASEAIDFVGIDAYFPLTNAKISVQNEEEIIKGWQSGEGYEYYYSDKQKTQKHPLNAAYAWKNIGHWWANEHVNPDGLKTPWRSRQKKIWFAEIGFPSVDLASNQPNVFYSPDSVESNFPLHSKGNVDFVAQRQALSASEKYWRNSEFLERMFIWTWDARPFPYWPDLNKVWADGSCWPKGHWVNGKLGLVTLEAVIQDLCKRAGLSLDIIRAEELKDLVDGIVINNQETAKATINLLKSAYFFDSHEMDGKLFFVKRNTRSLLEIKDDDLVSSNNHQQFALHIQKISPQEVIQSIAVNYFNYLFDYQISTEFATNCSSNSLQTMNLNLPLILDPQKAKTIAEISLQEIWYGQMFYEFVLAPNYIRVKPNDLIKLKYQGEVLTMRVITTKLDVGKVIKITAVSMRSDIYSGQAQMLKFQQSILLNKEHFDPGTTELIIININPLPYELPPRGVYLGVIGNDEHWRGAEVIGPGSYAIYFQYEATIGVINEDLVNELKLTMINGELNAKQGMGDDTNLAVIGEEIIEFSKAEFLGNGEYKLSGVRREVFGSKASDPADKKFILLDNNLQKFPISEQQNGRRQEFLVTSIGHDISNARKFEFVYLRKN